MKKKLHKASFFVIAAIVFLFVFASVFAQQYEDEIRAFVGDDGVLGMAAYVIVTVIAVVIAPVSTLPILPLASGMWGWKIAGALSVVGWTIGAQIAFFLARHFGKSFIEKFVSLKKLTEIENRLPKRHLFLSIVFLRMAIPVDVLSYALGLFSQMTSISYFFATLIGVAPFAFLLAYAGALPVGFQLATILSVMVIASLGYAFRELAKT